MKRVIKLGGSLFDMPGLLEVFHRWLDRQTPAAHVVIVGGGPTADVIRTLHNLDPIDDALAHGLCLRAMQQMAGIMASLLQLPRTDQWRAVRALGGDGTIVFDVYDFMRQVEPGLSGTPLPVGWQVTSDSIAARVAQGLGADELVLLKSALPDPAWTIDEAAAAGYVDEWFPTAAKGQNIRAVNLRDANLPDSRFRTM